MRERTMSLVGILMAAGLAAVAPPGETSGAPAAPKALYEDLFTYPEADLRELFRSIAIGTGERCEAVTGTAFVGRGEDDSGYFEFVCTGGESYLLQIRNDGTGGVVDCDSAIAMGRTCRLGEAP
jgi:hypothetical protein